MRYLGKRRDSDIEAEGLRYATDAATIRDRLRREQGGFCAYSESWIRDIDAHDVEHFDPRLKGTESDGYQNWFCVLHRLNLKKPRKIEPYLPILSPSSDLERHIRYVNGHFEPIDVADDEARRLIEFLGWNKYELAAERRAHVNRVRRLLDLGEPWAAIAQDPMSRSFATALEAELGVKVPRE